MTAPLRAGAPRVLAVGADGEACAVLHPAFEAAGHALWCVPSPGDLEAALRLAAPSLVLLLLPATPDPSWGAALSAAAAAAEVGVRIAVVAPLREVVEPLAAVAGAERALSRAELLAAPLSVLERAPPPGPPADPLLRADAWSAQVGRGAAPRDGSGAPAPLGLAVEEGRAGGGAPRITASFTLPGVPVGPPRRPSPTPVPAREPSRSPAFAPLDDELVGEARAPLRLGRVEVSVSLVSDHNFYVGRTRHLDSGGVFVASAAAPPPGTRLEIRLGLADGRKLDLDGEVAFVRERSAIGGRQPAGCGVRLGAVPGWAVDAIERFMLARPPIVWAPR